MAYIDQYELTTNVNFRGKILIAIASAGKDVAVEITSGDATTDTKRKNLAVGILNSPESYVDRFTIAVATNPAISSSSSDSDIQFTVNALFSSIAGV